MTTISSLKITSYRHRFHRKIDSRFWFSITFFLVTVLTCDGMVTVITIMIMIIVRAVFMTRMAIRLWLLSGLWLCFMTDQDFWISVSASISSCMWLRFDYILLRYYNSDCAPDLDPDIVISATHPPIPLPALPSPILFRFGCFRSVSFVTNKRRVSSLLSPPKRSLRAGGNAWIAPPL